MPRQTISLLAPTYKQRGLSSAGAQQLTNMYLQTIDDYNGRNKIAAVGTPGYEDYLTISGDEWRLLFNHQGIGYGVKDNTVYKLVAAGSTATPTSLGTISTSTGRLSVAATDTEIVICEPGSKIYKIVLATDTLTDITATLTGIDANLRPIWVLAYSSRFIYLTNIDNKVYISDLLDADTVSSVNYFTIDSSYGTLQSGITSNWYQYYFSDVNTEVWYDQGSFPIPFLRLPSGIINYGIASIHTAQIIQDTVIFLSKNSDGFQGIVAAQGPQAQVISPTWLVDTIKNYTSYDDSFAWVDSDNGIVFYNITFPNAELAPGTGANIGRTWSYNTITKDWYERRSYNPDQNRLDRYITNCHMFFDDKHIIGDYQSGKLYVWAGDYTDENGTEIIRQIITPHIIANDEFISLYNLEIDVERGQGLDGSSQGSDPKIVVQYSKDRGNTWSEEKIISCAPLGNFNKRVRLSSLGGGRCFTIRLTMSDPIKWRIVGATVEIERTDIN